MIEARWRIDGYYKADPKIVAKEIFSIGETATPAQIVEKAKDSKTELHKCFEWDNEKAAEKYRLEQARMVTHQLVYVEPKKPELPPIRVFFKTDKNDGYKPTVLILQKKEEYQKLLQQAMAELSAFKTKYHSLSELDEVFFAIDHLK